MPHQAATRQAATPRAATHRAAMHQLPVRPLPFPIPVTRLTAVQDTEGALTPWRVSRHACAHAAL